MTLGRRHSDICSLLFLTQFELLHFGLDPSLLNSTIYNDNAKIQYLQPEPEKSKETSGGKNVKKIYKFWKYVQVHEISQKKLFQNYWKLKSIKQAEMQKKV